MTCDLRSSHCSWSLAPGIQPMVNSGQSAVGCKKRCRTFWQLCPQAPCRPSCTKVGSESEMHETKPNTIKPLHIMTYRWSLIETNMVLDRLDSNTLCHLQAGKQCPSPAARCGFINVTLRRGRLFAAATLAAVVSCAHRTVVLKPAVDQELK